MQVHFSDQAGAAIQAVLVFADRPELPALGRLDVAAHDLLRQGLQARAFKADVGDVVELLLPVAGGMQRLIVLGGGRSADFGDGQAGKAGRALLAVPGCAGATIDLYGGGSAALAARVGFGLRLASYRDDRFRSTAKDEAPAGVRLILDDEAVAKAAEATFAPLAALADGVALARDLANAPPNYMTPALFARHCQQLADYGIGVELLGVETLTELGMGALLGVGQGSTAPPCVVVLRWNGTSAGDGERAPLVLAGKGVTFDSGGLLPKQPEEMWDMKYDRAGAAAVAGTLLALAARRAPVDVVGILGLAENMPSGHALRPGDVVTSHSGQTIEVLHTDAEGRLVLADLLSYARQRFAPSAMIDIATLTGGLTAVLTDQYAGLHASDEPLAEALLAAGSQSGEALWRLPLCAAFDRMLESPVADMQNISKQRWGGTATAAQFLRRFVGTTPWAHVDMFGPAWARGSSGPQGATGFGVRLLTALAETWNPTQQKAG